MNSEASEPIVPSTGGGSVMAAAISPDGKWVIFQIWPVPSGTPTYSCESLLAEGRSNCYFLSLSGAVSPARGTLPTYVYWSNQARTTL